MAKLAMTIQEVAGVLADILDKYIYKIEVVAETDEMMFFTGIEGDEFIGDGHKVELRVHKKPYEYADGLSYHMVEYRPVTGWADEEAPWRYCQEITQSIPHAPMTINEALAYDGLEVDEEAVKAAGYDWIHGDLMVADGREWLYGAPTEAPITYRQLLDIPASVRDLGCGCDEDEEDLE